MRLPEDPGNHEKKKRAGAEVGAGKGYVHLPSFFLLAYLWGSGPGSCFLGCPVGYSHIKAEVVVQCGEAQTPPAQFSFPGLP